MGAAASSALVLLSLEGSRGSHDDSNNHVNSGGGSGDYDYSLLLNKAGSSADTHYTHRGRPRFTLPAIRQRWAKQRQSRQLVENPIKKNQCIPPSADAADAEDIPSDLDVDIGLLAASHSTCAEGEFCLPSVKSPTGGHCQVAYTNATCPLGCPVGVCDCYNAETFSELCLKVVTDSCNNGSYVSNCNQAPVTPALEESNNAARQGTCDVYTCVAEACGSTPPFECYNKASYGCYCKGYAATCNLYQTICSLGVEGSAMSKNQVSNACYYAPQVCDLASCCTCNSGYTCIAEPKKAINCSTADDSVDKTSNDTTSSSKSSLAKSASFIAAVSFAITAVVGMLAEL